MKISPKISSMLSQHGRMITLDEKAELIAQGELNKRIYIVESGCLRLWRNVDGRDITVQFFLAGDAVSSFQSFIWAEPSRFTVEAVAPSTVHAIDKIKIDHFYKESEEFRAFMFDALFVRISEYQNLFINAISMDAQSRYQELLSNCPELLELSPHHYIASYLGVTPQSLSRIRKNALSLPNDNA